MPNKFFQDLLNIDVLYIKVKNVQDGRVFHIKPKRLLVQLSKVMQFGAYREGYFCKDYDETYSKGKVPKKRKSTAIGWTIAIANRHPKLK